MAESLTLSQPDPFVLKHLLLERRELALGQVAGVL